MAEPYPTVSTDDDAVNAARLFVGQRLPALLAVDRDGRPSSGRLQGQGSMRPARMA